MTDTPLTFFDMKAAVGHFLRPTPLRTPDELLNAMDRYGIAEAVVYHSMSRENHPLNGNPRAIEAADGSSRLHPAWSLLPQHSGDMPCLREYLRDGVRQGVKMVYIFPRHYFMSIEEFVRGRTFEECEEWRIPVVVDPDANPFGGMDSADWSGLRCLLRSHPRLPVIHTEFRLRTNQRSLCHLLEDHPNLHVDIGCCWNYRSVEFFARRFGSSRLVMGTGMPFRDPGQTVAMVGLAELDLADKQAIAAGNLRRLLADSDCKAVRVEVAS